MIASNIQWDIDMEEALDTLREKSDEEAAKLLDISVEQYAAMSQEERDDWAESKFRHCPAKLDELMDLPSEIVLPEEITDDEAASEWLSDTYGFCHSGFALDTDTSE